MKNAIASARFSLNPRFDNDKTKGEWRWKLLHDSVAKRGDFEPELAEFLPERKEDEDWVVFGDEMCRRVPEGFGQHHAEAMLRNQSAIPVEWRGYKLAFTGTIWQKDGDTFVPCLYWDGEWGEEFAWHLHFRWLGEDYGSRWRVVRPRKQ